MEYLLRFRRVPLQNLSETAAKDVLKQKGFYHRLWHPEGSGAGNAFEKFLGRSAIIDRAAGLLWQLSGSLERMDFESAAGYIDELNKQQFDGFSDWHLPTLEEAMSLITPARNAKDLFISPLFDARQARIWTADRYSATEAWVVGFSEGSCDYCPIIKRHYIRAVCAV